MCQWKCACMLKEGSVFFLSTFSFFISWFFYPDTYRYRIDIGCTSAQCKREAYLENIYPTLYLSDSHPLSVNLALDLDSRRGCCVPPVKKGGRKRAVSPQCEVRLKMATAEPAWGRPNHRKSYAMLCGWATWGSWGRFLCFLRGLGRFGSTVTNISGSTGYLTSETN